MANFLDESGLTLYHSKLKENLPFKDSTGNYKANAPISVNGTIYNQSKIVYGGKTMSFQAKNGDIALTSDIKGTIASYGDVDFDKVRALDVYDETSAVVDDLNATKYFLPGEYIIKISPACNGRPEFTEIDAELRNVECIVCLKVYSSKVLFDAGTLNSIRQELRYICPTDESLFPKLDSAADVVYCRTIYKENSSYVYKKFAAITAFGSTNVGEQTITVMAESSSSGTISGEVQYELDQTRNTFWKVGVFVHLDGKTETNINYKTYVWNYLSGEFEEIKGSHGMGFVRTTSTSYKETFSNNIVTPIPCKGDYVENSIIKLKFELTTDGSPTSIKCYDLGVINV